MNISITDIIINIVIPAIGAGILVPIIMKWLDRLAQAVRNSRGKSGEQHWRGGCRLKRKRLNYNKMTKSKF